jgi:gluconolactonase
LPYAATDANRVSGERIVRALSPAGGKAIKVADRIERPNGIQLSRAEKALFVNNTNGLYILTFDINPDGTLRNRRNFAVYEGRSQTPNGIPGIMTGADGLVIDSEAVCVL